MKDKLVVLVKKMDWTVLGFKLGCFFRVLVLFDLFV